MSDRDTMRSFRRKVGVPFKLVQGIMEISLAGLDRNLLNQKSGGDGKRP